MTEASGQSSGLILLTYQHLSEFIWKHFLHMACQAAWAPSTSLLTHPWSPATLCCPSSLYPLTLGWPKASWAFLLPDDSHLYNWRMCYQTTWVSPLSASHFCAKLWAYPSISHKLHSLVIRSSDRCLRSTNCTLPSVGCYLEVLMASPGSPVPRAESAWRLTGLH